MHPPAGGDERAQPLPARALHVLQGLVGGHCIQRGIRKQCKASIRTSTQCEESKREQHVTAGLTWLGCMDPPEPGGTDTDSSRARGPYTGPRNAPCNRGQGAMGQTAQQLCGGMISNRLHQNMGVGRLRGQTRRRGTPFEKHRVYGARWADGRGTTDCWLRCLVAEAQARKGRRLLLPTPKCV